MTITDSWMMEHASRHPAAGPLSISCAIAMLDHDTAGPAPNVLNDE